MTHLHMHLFGAITAEPALRLPTDKTRALLVYLALTADIPLRREAVAGLLWPDQPETLARQNLRKTLGRLKQALDEAAEGMADAVLSVSKQTIALHGAQVTADIRAFAGHLESVRSHPHVSLATCPACQMRLAAAVALYQRGDFLAGLSLPDAPPFEEWLLLQRENLYQQQLAALHQLTEIHIAQGAFELAQRYAQAQIALEPWREEAHRQLMRLLASHGRRAEAIAQYHACYQLLQDELGVLPSAATEALLAQIEAESIPRAAVPNPERLHHFPALMTPLIGRAVELAELTRQLTDPTCRLLTMTGQGGMGKTSLATAAAHTLARQPVWPAGLYFIPLEGVTTAERLILAIGRSLGLVFQNQQTSQQQLAAYLRDKNCLLVLDNFEQLVENAAVVGDLVAATDQLTILVTSREPLNIRAEQRFHLAGLPFPQEDVTTPDEPYGALELFEAVGQRVRPRFAITADNEAAVRQICRMVGGAPLALELAAHWLRLMDCAQIAAEIGRNLSFLASNLRDMPERHRSMQVVFEQSWQQLSGVEQGLLAQLSVFRGGFELADGLALAPLATGQAGVGELAALLDKSLVQSTQHGRYALHELVRQFAAAKLAELEAQASQQGGTQRQHSLYYLAQVRNLAPLFAGATPHVAHDAVQRELENVLQAWETAVGQNLWLPLGDVIQPLVDYYEMAGTFVEALTNFSLAAESAQQQITPHALPAEQVVLGYLLAQTAWFMYVVGSSKEARPLAEKALALATQLGHGHLRAVALYRLGLVAWRLNETAEAIALLTEAYQQFRHQNDVLYAVSVAGNLSFRHGRLNQDEADLAYAKEAYLLAQAHGSVFALATALDCLSYYHERHWQLAEAILYREQADSYFRQAQWQAGLALHQISLGNIYLRQGALAKALATYELSLAFYQKTGNASSILNLQSNMANVYVRLGQYDEGLALHQAVLASCAKLENRWGMLLSLTLIGEEQIRRKLYAEAAITLAQAGELAEAVRSPQKQALVLSLRGLAAVRQEQWVAAQTLLQEALHINHEIENRQGQALDQYHLGLLAAVQGQAEAAVVAWSAAQALYRTLADPYHLAQVLVEEAAVRYQLGQYGTAAALNGEGLALARQIGRGEYIGRGEALARQLAKQGS